MRHRAFVHLLFGTHNNVQHFYSLFYMIAVVKPPTYFFALANNFEPQSLYSLTVWIRVHVRPAASINVCGCLSRTCSPFRVYFPPLHTAFNFSNPGILLFLPVLTLTKRRGPWLPRTLRLRNQEPPSYIGVTITTVIDYYRSTAILGVFNQSVVPISVLC